MDDLPQIPVFSKTWNQNLLYLMLICQNLWPVLASTLMGMLVADSGPLSVFK